ncbi:MAG: right-handed parallel beta-helix repeat-containing protein [Candidatus Pacebacteria bacterium]|nr:right-handed parallel beta-helix repeat-containing protein [Candidatus Paceibacterota bacterium]
MQQKERKMTPRKLTIHVAPGGCDNAEGTEADPLATPAAAVTVCRRAGTGGCTIVLHGGRYELDEPLRLDPRDSGLTLAAAPGESPVLSGGRVLTGWEPEPDGRLWSAPAPGTETGAWDFRQLYVEGEARPNARLPETGTWRHATTFHEPYDPCFDPLPSEEKRSRLAYGQNQLPPDLSLKNAEFVILHAWDDSHTQAAAHDPDTRTLRLDPPCTYPPGCFNVQEYYVLNLREGMTKPGQWYLDRECGRVVYWPLPGEDLNRSLIEAPYLTSLVRIEGSGTPVWEHNVKGQGVLVTRFEGGRPVVDVTLRGLTLDLTTTALVEKAGRVGSGYPGSEEQSSPGVWSEFFTGAVMLQHARACRLSGLIVRRSGGQGVKLVHTDDMTIEQCEITHCGANGIASNFGARNAVVNNRVLHVGELRNFAVGIHGINWSRGRIAHNEVSDCTYCGITLSNGNRAKPLPAENAVEYNHVWNVMNALDDGGCIYFSWSQRGTVVRGNILHGSHGRTSLANGLYLDIGVDGVTCEGNLVYDIDEASLHVHMARNNVLRNNVFVCGRKRGISFAGSSGCVFERNIVVGTERDIQFLNPDGARFNSNLYWSAVGPPRFARSATNYGSQPFATGYARASFLVLDAAPEISASPRPEDWSRAMTVDRFVRSSGAEAAAEHRIEARFLRQDALLHVHIRIERPPPAFHCGGGTLWNHEHTELFLKPFAEGPGMVQLGVASDGECAACWSVSEPPAFRWHAAVHPLAGDQGWDTTFRVPLDALAAACGEGALNPAFVIGCTVENRALTLAEWQGQGRDPDGMAADPLFVDPAAGDFRVCPESPAFKLGFVPLTKTTQGAVGHGFLPLSNTSSV